MCFPMITKHELKNVTVTRAPHNYGGGLDISLVTSSLVGEGLSSTHVEFVVHHFGSSRQTLR